MPGSGLYLTPGGWCEETCPEGHYALEGTAGVARRDISCGFSRDTGIFKKGARFRFPYSASVRWYFRVVVARGLRSPLGLFLDSF